MTPVQLDVHEMIHHVRHLEACFQVINIIFKEYRVNLYAKDDLLLGIFADFLATLLLNLCALLLLEAERVDVRVVGVLGLIWRVLVLELELVVEGSGLGRVLVEAFDSKVLRFHSDGLD